MRLSEWTNQRPTQPKVQRNLVRGKITFSDQKPSLVQFWREKHQSYVFMSFVDVTISQLWFVISLILVTYKGPSRPTSSLVQTASGFAYSDINVRGQNCGLSAIALFQIVACCQGFDYRFEVHASGWRNAEWRLSADKTTLIMHIFLGLQRYLKISKATAKILISSSDHLHSSVNTNWWLTVPTS